MKILVFLMAIFLTCGLFAADKLDGHSGPRDGVYYNYWLQPEPEVEVVFEEYSDRFPASEEFQVEEKEETSFNKARGVDHNPSWQLYSP